MKNTLLTIAAFAIASAASAQITITQNDVAPLYTQMRQAVDTMPTVNEGSAGASQTWNYSTLPAHRVDTITFTLPQFTPYGSTFPSSNLAADNRVAGTQSFIYLNNSPNGIEIHGQASDPIGTGDTVAIPFTNPETFITFPSTYNTAFTDTANGMVQMYYGVDPGIGFTVDSFRIRSWVMKTSLMDAWGSVTTPAGTYNTLRQNVKRVQYDTIDIYAFGNWFYEYFTQMDSNRVYSFWANGAGFPVAELTDEQEMGTITNAWWLQSTAVVGIPENNTASAFLYPNPASDNITFVSAGTAATFITIYDMNGQLIEKQSVTGDRTGFNVGGYAPGMYFYQASDANGNLVSRGKFNVAH